MRTLLEYSWARDEDGLLVARVVADAFCHSMVRALVGALLAGRGRPPPGGLARRGARGRVRDPAAAVVGPHGLSLEEVAYPDDARLAERAATGARRPDPADRLLTTGC